MQRMQTYWAAYAERRHLRQCRWILAHVTQPVLVVAQDGRIVATNASCSEVLGYTAAELSGMSAHELLRDASRRDAQLEGVVPLARKDGRQIALEATVLHSSSGGRLKSVLLRDVTERIRKEEQVRANERLFEGIFQILPVGVWIADKDARIVRGNPAGVRIWAGARYVDPSQFGEYRGWWASTGKRIEPDEWAFARALRRGETSIGELIRIQCFDGTYKTIINSALPLYDDSGNFAGAIAVNEDVTLLNEAEADLQRALASRDRVLGIVAHDLRSPLNVIQLKLQLLVQGGARRDDRAKALHTIQQQVTAMDRLIGDLLDASAIELGKLMLELSAVPCAPLIDEVFAAHEALARDAGVTISADVDPGAPDMIADRGRLIQVLNNLLGNALKFTPEGGMITVGAAPAAPTGTLFRVVDTGVGIEPEFLNHVFDPLWQRRADPRGVGLGLAIAKAIVEAHGGAIWAQSAVGSGTAVFFTIPQRFGGYAGSVGGSRTNAARRSGDPQTASAGAASGCTALGPTGSLQ